MTRLDKYVLAFALGVAAVGFYGGLTKSSLPPMKSYWGQINWSDSEAAKGYKR